MILNANILMQNRILVDSTYLTMTHTFVYICLLSYMLEFPEDVLRKPKHVGACIP
jgi:hypothetical protein